MAQGRTYVGAVKLIGLGGGIGSGKSTVSALLAARGAVIVDADVIARQVVEPGTRGLAALVERFGPTIVQPDGTLDRKALAAVAFADPEALKALNAITHPEIALEIARRIAEHRGTDAIVVLDAALLFDSARDSMVGKIAVDVDPRLAVERLRDQRGFTEAEAWARINAQMSREDRRARADLVLDNSADRAHLDREVSRAWAWILTRGDSPEPGPAVGSARAADSLS